MKTKYGFYRKLSSLIPSSSMLINIIIKGFLKVLFICPLDTNTVISFIPNGAFLLNHCISNFLSVDNTGVWNVTAVASMCPWLIL